MSTRRVTRSSQNADSNWPERTIEEKDTDAEVDDESLHDEEALEQVHLGTLEDQVDITNILLAMQDMQKKIDLLMKKHSLMEREAAVVSPRPKRPKIFSATRSTPSIHEEASQS